ncbi:hypothetical protein [Rhizobium ruizarguesonis]|uniref:hypothetical protein n=1 Tax=Rhizobium ruizarguesonis TaxID=2081791 RepID=UPI003711AB9E
MSVAYTGNPHSPVYRCNKQNLMMGLPRCMTFGGSKVITTFTERGIESLKEFLADIRTWNGGVRQFLADEQCDPEKIERRCHVVGNLTGGG